ncbi:helix-turn-helix domain-containing protein [soil metagenome]
MSDTVMSQPVDVSEKAEFDTGIKPMLSVVESAGSLLAAARQKKSWSVQQAAEQLKLSPRQILALEANQYEVLPQMAIVRGFARAYAKLLKIDADAVVALLPEFGAIEQFDTALKPSLSAPFLESRLSLMGRQDNNHKYLFGAALLAVLAIGFLLLQKFERADLMKNLFSRDPATVVVIAPERVVDSLPPLAPIVDVPHVAPASPVSPSDIGLTSNQKVVELASVAASSGAISEADAVSKNTLEAALKVGNAASTSNVEATGDVMKLKFRQDTWMQIKKANGILVASHLARAGTEETFVVSEPLQVRIGNAAGVEGVLRGAPMEIFAGKGSNVVNLSVK